MSRPLLLLGGYVVGGLYRLLVLVALLALGLGAFLLFLLLGECEAEACQEQPSESFTINAAGELCQRCAYSPTRLERPVSGRFTATGKLLVRQ